MLSMTSEIPARFFPVGQKSMDHTRRMVYARLWTVTGLAGVS